MSLARQIGVSFVRMVLSPMFLTVSPVAPEVIELKGASTASDIWSLACTVIELLTGKPPYSDIGNGMSGKYYTNLYCGASSQHTPLSNVPHRRR